MKTIKIELSKDELKKIFAIKLGKSIDAKRLYRFIRSVNWECGNGHRCWDCDKYQHWECLVHYRKEWKKKLRKKDLLSGIPYTKNVLKKLPRKDLSVLTGIFKINLFKLRDKSSKGLVSTILIAQKNYKNRYEYD